MTSDLLSEDGQFSPILAIFRAPRRPISVKLGTPTRPILVDTGASKRSILVKLEAAGGPILVNFGPPSRPLWAPGHSTTQFYKKYATAVASEEQHGRSESFDPDAVYKLQALLLSCCASSPELPFHFGHFGNTSLIPASWGEKMVVCPVWAQSWKEAGSRGPWLRVLTWTPLWSACLQYNKKVAVVRQKSVCVFMIGCVCACVCMTGQLHMTMWGSVQAVHGG